jgi:mitogen-activated protein kinase 1/3
MVFKYGFFSRVWKNEEEPEEEIKESNDGQRVSTFIRKERFDLDSRYEPIKKLGKGAYGMVISAKDHQNNDEKVAIKKNINVFQNRTSAKRILREIKLLSHCNHPNIVRLLDIVNPLTVEDFDSMYLVLEYMQSDLHRVIYSDNILSDGHIAFIIYQILCGLKYLHGAGVYHRDLKPSNILVNRECKAKICDFGLARVVDDEEELLTQYVVTRWYRAPEVVLNERHYGAELDVWSVGCILAEMYNRSPIFPGKDYSDQLCQIFGIIGSPSREDVDDCVSRDPAVHHFLRKLGDMEAKSWKDILPSASEEAIDLISKLLTFNPKKRISVEDALRHPFLSRYYDEEFVSKDCVSQKRLDVSYEHLIREKDDIKVEMFNEILQFRPEAVFPTLESAKPDKAKNAKFAFFANRRTLTNE